MSRFNSKNIEIFLISFTMLFLEIALIRWLSTEIRIFAYFNNLVILSCFLGIGLGCYLSNRGAGSISGILLRLSILIALVTLPIFLTVRGSKVHLFRDIPTLLSAFTDSVIWYKFSLGSNLFNTLFGISSTLVIFFIVLFIFVPFGQILGNALNRHEKIILAYSINIIASILGIWCFSALSFIYSPPWVWFVLFSTTTLAMVLFLDSHRSIYNLLSMLGYLLLIVYAIYIPTATKSSGGTIWSPYQKLRIRPYYINANSNAMGGYLIEVNNVGYMTLIDLSEDSFRRNPDRPDHKTPGFSQYDIPYMFKADAKDVLILGAGAGNDAAGALRNGASSIDAVEIDPAIYGLGVLFHPERPYSDPKVNVIIDDARSFFKKSKKEYDLISFGLLDAHTLSSTYNNMRLDHYVYTLESFREAKALLKKDGLLTVIFEAQRPWIARRIRDLLKKTFGDPPLVFQVRSGGQLGFGGLMFVSGNVEMIKNAMRENQGLSQFISKNQIQFSQLVNLKPVKLTTDNWPYLYLEKPIIPRMHLFITGILALIFIVARKALLPGKELDLHFFFLGAAFLLLEFQNISKTALLFGSTWLVNTFIISAILLLTLFANIFVSIFKVKDIKPFYFLLILSVSIVFLTPLNLFNFLGYWQKSILVSAILNLPIFFAGVIFATSFKKTLYKDLAFGSNIIGAATGGILESLSFITGVNMLLLVVMGFYILSFIFQE